MTTSKLIGLDDAARAAGVEPGWLRRMAKDGKLATVRCGRRLLTTHDRVKRLIGATERAARKAARRAK